MHRISKIKHRIGGALTASARSYDQGIHASQVTFLDPRGKENYQIEGVYVRDNIRAGETTFARERTQHTKPAKTATIPTNALVTPAPASTSPDTIPTATPATTASTKVPATTLRILPFANSESMNNTRA
jgi:hypothetical protein